MNRFPILITIMSMTIICSCGSNGSTQGKNKTTDFRNASWGESMADVMAGDEADIQPNGPKTLYGKDTLLNDDIRDKEENTADFTKRLLELA